MGLVRTIALVVLSISLVVFIALFGRLPAFRKTPIAFLHKLLWKYIPNGIVWVDERLTGRRVTRSLARTGDYLMNDKHPVVLIFFVSLQLGGEALFIPTAWTRLTTFQSIILIPLVTLPYSFLYLCATTTSNITPTTHRSSMLTYPYDYALFHPGYFCSTCHLAKPARSKHCPICKSCIQRQDHHCIWVNNCVGRNNYLWFNCLLLSVEALLLYGTVVGLGVLDQRLQNQFVPPDLIRGSLSTRRWSTRLTWSEWSHAWAWVVATEWRIGAVVMLASMCVPLALGFLLYHVYLMWAGMTTNESSKWADWKEDILDGCVWRAELKGLRREFEGLPREVEPREEDYGWPKGVRAKWWLIRTRDGKAPKRKVRRGGNESGENGHGVEQEVPDERWEQVHSIADVQNVYDLGFWDNVRDSLFNRG